MKQFPRQDIPEKDKTPAWVGKHLEYGEHLLKSYDSRKRILTRLYHGYNGLKTPQSLSWLEKTYGRENKAKFISYRLGRNKMSLMQGEWLETPLRATVETTNSEAKVSKLDHLDMITGAMHAKQEIGMLKERAGVDVMEGMPIPDNEEDPLWASMSVKDKNENIMQTILDEEIKTQDLKKKIADQFLDACIGGFVFGRIEIDEEGNTNFQKIDPRNAIYEEIENDDFLEKSPIKGCRIQMTVHDCLRKFKFTEDQRNLLEQLRSQPDKYTAMTGYPRTFYLNGELCVDVVHINWKSVRPTYYKKSPKTQAQLAFDSTNQFYKIELNTEEYEKNKSWHDKQVALGKYEIETEWAEDLWEAARIGSSIQVLGRRKPFQMRRVDAPTYILDSEYVGCLFGTVDGIRISLQQVIENFDNMFDIVMYQILKELNRVKGKVLAFDRSATPKGKSYKQIIYEAVNDGFIDFDSSAAGNVGRKDLGGIEALFKEYDLGMSSSFPALLELKREIRRTLDDLTGINQEREGDIAASATATNSQANVASSRKITEILFYNFSLYVEKLLMKICESSKISWAFYKVEKGRQILGDAKHNFLVEITKDIGYQDYGVHLEDGAKYKRIRDVIARSAEAAMNSKQINIPDLINVELAESVSEMRKTMEAAWKRVQDEAAASQQRDNEAKDKMNQDNLAMQKQMADEEREDRQKNEKDNIILQGKVDLELQNNASKGKLILDQNKHDNESFAQE